MFAFLEWFSFSGALKWAHDAAVKVVEYLWELIASLFGPLWNSIASAVSSLGSYVSTMSSALQSISGYIAFINAWVPVDVFINLVIAYSGFWLALVVYRSIKKWIPFVSG